jgi:hypothetical protein
MNEFVNFRKRSIELPAGCKDLIDMLPPPRETRMPVEGFAHIERYLSRIFQAGAKRRSVIVWSLDYQEHVHVSNRDGVLSLMVVVDTQDAIREEAVLRLFREAGVIPVRDEDGRGDGIQLRALIYPLTPSVPAAADLIRSLLQGVYGIAHDAGLLFQYHERDAA